MLHLPETAHLYALLNCAQYNQGNYLEPELEAYLIQTMLRYSELSDNNDCMDFSTATDLSIADEQQDAYLKEIADYCLICTGLMAEYFNFEEDSYERLQEVGQHAFAMLSKRSNNRDNIYLKLSNHFLSLVDVLQCSQTLISNKDDITVDENNMIHGLPDKPLSIMYSNKQRPSSNVENFLYH